MNVQGETKCTMTHVRQASVSEFVGPSGCRRKFLRFFPGGFRDTAYMSWEREYKWNAHVHWKEQLNTSRMRTLIENGEHLILASRAVGIESRTNLLFSFEKIALRDALRDVTGARIFCEGLFDFLHGPGTGEARFERWVDAVARLPRRQTRVLAWPLVTVFGFIAQPERHIFLKPNVT